MTAREAESKPFVGEALDHAARGWPVFPLEPGGKRPLGRLVPHGLHDASTDPDRIRSWWQAEPRANIGLRTGVAFDVLDLDGPDALTALDRAMPAAENPDDDPTLIGPTVRTPRGWHVYVASTGRGNGVNVAGLAGVDWRGAGGYVVGPGSVRDDGTPWSWYLPDDPLYGPDAGIRPPPTWLVDLHQRRHLTALPSTPAPMGRAGTAYAQAALERACGRLASAPVGTRNHALNAEAHGLGRLVGARQLTASQAGDALLGVALRIGLGESEATATIRSGLTAGIRTPRQAS
ncbi:MAG: bifunctional DNA primase/polymerase [Acidimicrobiales bacterium]